LVDVGLPDGSGIEVVEYIKKNNPEMGVIIVTAKNALEDKLEGLKIGADDYLTKPFHLSELSARIYSVLRRRNFGGKNTLSFDGLEIDTTEKKVIANGNQLQLTKKEYEILVYLASNPTHLITKEALADAIWGDKADMATSFDFVYSQIKNLKKKLNEADLKNYIKVVYGMGYKFKD
jgi:DNA-binding response OmpR family regulator